MKDKIKRIALYYVPIIILFCLNLFFIWGCEKIDSAQPDTDHIDSGRFIAIEKGLNYSVIVDQETGVEYIWGSNASITPLIDKDGKPLIWEEGG